MARDEIHDSSVLIKILHSPDRYGEAFFRSIEAGRAWLSSVVVAELYAGSRSPGDSRWIDRIVRAMKADGRLLTPTHDDWAIAARLIARYIRNRGKIVPRDHLADALIVISASQVGGTVLTYNVGHMETWAALARASRRDVTVAEYAP